MKSDRTSKTRLRKSFLVKGYERHKNIFSEYPKYEDDFFVYQPDDIEVMHKVDKMLKLCLAAASAVPLLATAVAYTFLGFRSR